MNEEKCGNCKYYRDYWNFLGYEETTTIGSGFCLRHAPKGKGMQDIENGFPQTFYEKWCGDWFQALVKEK